MSKLYLPGDDLEINSQEKLVIGPGIYKVEEKVVANKAGILCHHKPEKYFIESFQKRYIPMVGDNVIGLITARHGDFYKVDLASCHGATLSNLAFEGATKRNRPNLQIGNIVYCKVIISGKDIEPEVTCMGENLKSNGLGELKNGFLTVVSCTLARKLALMSSEILDSIGKTIAFEIVIGMNGRIWINSASSELTLNISDSLKEADKLPANEQISFIRNSIKPKI